MPALTVVNPVFEQTSGIALGQSVRIDLKHRPFAIDSWGIRGYARFNVPAAGATLKCFASLMLLKEVRLSGSRAGGTDTMKQLTGMHLARNNAYDFGIDSPVYYEPSAMPAVPTVLPAGTYDIGFNLCLSSSPYRMNYGFSNLFMIPGPLYSNLQMEIDIENLANLFSVGGAGVTLVTAGLEVEQVDVPSIDCRKTNFGSFQETYKRDTITAVNNAGFEVSLPKGNYFYQIGQHVYTQAANQPCDFLIGKIELRENISTLRTENWNRLRERNRRDFNLSDSMFTYGYAVHRFAEQGREDALLNTTDFGTLGRDLTLRNYIPTLPGGWPTPFYLDTVSRIIVPRISA